MSDKIYWRDYEYANDHGQTEAFRSSHLRNAECAKAIEKAIADNFDGYCLDKAAADSLIQEFGFVRTMAVSAQILRALDHDGRIASDTKAWAAAFPVLHESGHSYIYISSHPGLLGIFSEEVGRIFEREVLQNQIDIGNKVGHYTITASIMLSNGRGFALGKNPNAAAPHATWQFNEDDGKREYYWGNYYAGATSAKVNLYERIFEKLSDGLELFNPLAAAEMSAEQNYNMIDGVRNNEKPRDDKPSVMEQIKAHKPEPRAPQDKTHSKNKGEPEL